MPLVCGTMTPMRIASPAGGGGSRPPSSPVGTPADPLGAPDVHARNIRGGLGSRGFAPPPRGGFAFIAGLARLTLPPSLPLPSLKLGHCPVFDVTNTHSSHARPAGRLDPGLRRAIDF